MLRKAFSTEWVRQTLVLVTSPPSCPHSAAANDCRWVNTDWLTWHCLQTAGHMIGHVVQPYSVPFSKWSRSGISVIDCDRSDDSTIDRYHDRDRAQPYATACRNGNELNFLHKDMYVHVHCLSVATIRVSAAIQINKLDYNPHGRRCLCTSIQVKSSSL